MGGTCVGLDGCDDAVDGRDERQLQHQTACQLRGAQSERAGTGSELAGGTRGFRRGMKPNLPSGLPPPAYPASQLLCQRRVLRRRV